MLPVSGLKRRGRLLFLALAAVLLLPPGPAPAGDCCANTGGKAILLMAFGTNVEQARQVYAKITEAAKARFPGVPLRWAYTSQQIRQKLAQEGRPVLSPAQALANLAEDGFTRVAVLSLNIVPGAEFAALENTAQRFSGMPKVLQRVTMGQPLLASSADMQRVAQALLASTPLERQPGEALVYMGHGTSGQANAAYPALASILRQQDNRAYLGTVEGSPDLAAVKTELLAVGLKKAWLIPLMTVAGEHARKDMAGPEGDSWASQLTAAGIAGQPILRGLAEYPAIVAVWLDHLQVAWEALDKE